MAVIRFAAALGSFLLSTALLFSLLEAPGPRRPENDGLSRTVDVDTGGVAPASVFVMTFIDTSDPDASGANRSQALVARSISDQYEQKGVRVIVVQSSGGRRAGQDPGEQLNVRYDWGLAEMTVIPDPERRLAKAFAVREFPTTMVMGSLGNLIAVWEGYSPPSVLGPALDRISLQSQDRATTGPADRETVYRD